MTRLITWFVHNPVAANLLMVFIVIGMEGHRERQGKRETYH